MCLVVRQNSCSCFFKGRRGPELACGLLQHALSVQAAVTQSSILTLTQSLSPGAARKLLNDYHTAKDVLVSGFILKLGFWQTFPYKVFSLAHPDETTARAGALQD